MVTRQYGFGEMPYEDSTMDGKVNGDELDRPIFAKHGLRLGDQHLDRSHRKGVTRLITPPMTDGFFHGVSAGFRTGATSSKFHACYLNSISLADAGRIVLDHEAVPCADCALHFTIGHEGKRKCSISREYIN